MFHLPHDFSFSSLPSEQWSNPSQSNVEFMQVGFPDVHLTLPSRHFQSTAIDSHNRRKRCHKIDKQMLIIYKPHNPSASSLPSVQSSSPSHTQSHGMHCRSPIEQLKLFLWQLTSTGRVNQIGFLSLAGQCNNDIVGLLQELRMSLVCWSLGTSANSDFDLGDR